MSDLAVYAFEHLAPAVGRAYRKRRLPVLQCLSSPLQILPTILHCVREFVTRPTTLLCVFLFHLLVIVQILAFGAGLLQHTSHQQSIV